MTTSEKISFPGALGETLAARLDRPDGPPRAYALWAHCFSCTKDVFAASRVARALTESGIAVLRFDFTGLGASEGDFANTNFSSNVGDLIAAADYMRAHLQAPAMLLGHSLGGAAVLAAAANVPEAKAVITIGAPADPAHVAHHFRDSLEEIEANGEAEVLLVGRPFRVKRQFLDDIQAQKLEQAIGGLGRALLIFHSPVDAIVGIENAAAIYRAARHPKSFVSLDDADHLLSKKEDAEYVAGVIAAWAKRYVCLDGAAAKPPVAPDAAPGTVVVEETGEGKFQNAVSVGGRHLLLADEPEAMGGTDTGPGPYDFLLTALGACTAMTVRMYAEMKDIPLTKVRVILRHDKIHAEDCQTCETKKGKLDRIVRDLHFEGDLSDEQKTRLMEIADKCPVHRTLHSEIVEESRLV
ncbi:MAG: osmotically inducible protein C [Rhodospirillales bacterium CG15_BIG_FIL_POST_REV_8_21_14_020_66_15]|nr:MAG: osmotically inducible protein C [Rhodospirillales bacterium CG15_BIG_FIL_POST_REV_8_21_14_020_66_15]